jgi:PAS domain S-box-containing protein
MNPDQKVNILMVDDQPAKLLSYEVILGELGENLIKARSGSEALDHLLRNDIAVVLMDVSMPEIDGFELAEMIRQHPRFQKTAIIFISGVHLSDEDRIKAYKRGAVDYISVPVVPEVLRAKVSVFVDLHRKTRMLESLNTELERRVEQRTQELAESEKQFRTLADSIPQLAWMADSDGSIFWYNQRWYDFTGLSADDLQGFGWRSVHHPDHLHRIEHGLSKAWSSGELWEDTFPIRSGTGEYRWFLSRAVPILDSHGRVVRWFGTATDITSRLLTEQALRQSEKLAAMGRVAGIIAHEINNPLEALMNAFFLLRDHESLDGEAKELAEMAEQELQRVCHITKQTLTFYRESKEPIPISICELLDSVVELQTRRIQLNRVELKKDYQTEALIQGYPVELRQVFLNLISNAIQAMPEGGTLTLRVRPTRNGTARPGFYISIIDTGSGVSKADAKQLFEPFFSTKAEKGTGLGLWISKGIVQKYEGTIRFRTVFSQFGNRTCFSVFLPSETAAVTASGRVANIAGAGRQLARSGYGAA